MSTAYPPKPRTLKPSQIANLLQYLTGIPIHGLIVACWHIKRQAQCEHWADFVLHNEVIRDLEHWPVGPSRRLPPCARHYLTQAAFTVSYKKGCEWQRKEKFMAEVEAIRLMWKAQRRA